MKVTLRDRDNALLYEGVSCVGPDRSELFERHLSFHNEFSTAEHTEIIFDGVRIIYGEADILQDVWLRTDIDQPLVEMYFLLGGVSQLWIDNKKQVILPANQHNMAYLPPAFEGEFLLQHSREKYRMFDILFTESFFHRLMDEDSPALSRLAEYIEKKQLAKLVQHNMTVTPKMKSVIAEITHCKLKGHMKRLLLEAKTIELFTLQVEMSEEQRIVRQPVGPGDTEKLHAVKSILEERPFEQLTLLDIAREVGLNDFKLKKGFRELFGTTVFGYLNGVRMEHARRLLLDENKTVAEVAHILGYSEPHHFSKAFKRTYGLLPRELKM